MKPKYHEHLQSASDISQCQLVEMELWKVCYSFASYANKERNSNSPQYQDIQSVPLLSMLMLFCQKLAAQILQRRLGTLTFNTSWNFLWFPYQRGCTLRNFRCFERKVCRGTHDCPWSLAGRHLALIIKTYHAWFYQTLVVEEHTWRPFGTKPPWSCWYLDHEALPIQIPLLEVISATPCTIKRWNFHILDISSKHL